MAYTKYYKLITAVTCVDDETGHVVKFQPIEDTYDDNAVTATQGSTEQSIYYASLDEDTTYDVYVDDTRIDRIQALNAIAS